MDRHPHGQGQPVRGMDSGKTQAEAAAKVINTWGSFPAARNVLTEVCS